MKALIFAGTALAAVLAQPAQAQSASDSQDFSVIGNVPALCVGGAVTPAGGIFDLGVLVDTATGFLRTDLSAPAQLIQGSFCSSRSTIAVVATPILAQGFTGTAPAGFSRSIDYVASANGWTASPAVFATASASNAAASQTRETPFSGPISVGIAGFATTGGSALRMVADTSYLGTVTVTLTPDN
ncbi:hypothetical protein GGQ88_001618 [Novosphingobium hassiacum]|uniref:DUF4402 domain-containing protein n=1 Tax=Novosphingobium hassiacum TaxID=173676 RepID=A0A7W5ZVW9_9SPHN|nr:hypothetical protein [Novosphingobium hassiacum]MBB3860352.1 hypothetical protein [Novosphingobium hassiacum]